MARKRRVFGGKFRAKVALAAIRGDKTLSQLASQFNVSGNQVSAWKRKLHLQSADLLIQRLVRHCVLCGTSPSILKQLRRLHQSERRPHSLHRKTVTARVGQTDLRS